MTRTGCIVAGLIAVMGGCSPGGGFLIRPVPADQTLQMTTVERAGPLVTQKIAIIDIEGLLENADQGFLFEEGEHPVSLAVEKLDACAKDASIRGVVLRINSPGGTVTASDVLYEEVRRFRTLTGKPVVAVLMDVAASGGYYVACGADEIIAHRTTVTGSIGVIMQTVSLSGTLDKLGIKAEAITSGPMKDAGSPLRDMKPHERAVFQKIIDELYQQFVAAVKAGRPKIDAEKLASIADGRVYTAEQALALGLIDRVGTLRDGVEAAKARAGVKRANTVIFRRPLTWRPNVYARANPQGTTVNFLSLSTERLWTNTPRFCYLWTIQ